jgi:hemerythrin superfamily protein
MSDTRPGGSNDPLDFLTHQHRQVEQVWTQLQAAHANEDDVQAELVEQLVAMLLTHDAIETELLYPAVRAHGGEQGAEIADHSLDEHENIREQLRRVDGTDPLDEEMWDALSQCIDAVNHHVVEEETIVFPLLREHWGADEQAEMCERMAEMLEASPTYP